MRIDAVIGIGLAGVADAARDAQAAGYDGVWTSDAHHNPFLPLVLAAAHTDRVELGTRRACAFSRDPLTVAGLADDLQLYSRGRFVLGLHGDETEQQTDRLREFVLLLRAAWRSWCEGDRLEFRGEFYTRVEAQPRGRGANPYGRARVFLSGRSERMAELAGEVADGFVCPELLAAADFEERIIPGLARGLERSRRSFDRFEITASGPIATGLSDWELRRATAAVRRQTAVLAAQTAHAATLERSGLGELHAELRAFAREGRWAAMTELIDDEVLGLYAVVGEPHDVGVAIHERHAGALDRVTLDLPYDADPERSHAVTQAIRAGWEHAEAGGVRPGRRAAA